MWRLVIFVLIAGICIGAARAWWELGSLDPSLATANFNWPESDAPDYWQVPPGKAAKAVLDSEEFPFGKLEIGRSMQHAFRVTNAGDFPLILAKRESSCICTLAEIAEKPIAPGESAEVTLEWTAPAEGRPGEPFRQWTTIDTNDRDRPTITLYVEGELSAAVAVEDDPLSFGTIAKSQTKTLSTRLISYRTLAPKDKAALPPSVTSFSIERTEFDDPAARQYIDIHTAPADREPIPSGAAAALQVQVTLKPGLPEGPFRQTIRLGTNLTDVPPAILTIVGEVRPIVYLTGPGYSQRTNTLALGAVDAAKPVERRISLVMFGSNDTSESPKIIEVSPAVLEAEFVGPAETGEAGSKRWSLEVRLPPTVAAAGENGKIVIDTGQAEMPRVEFSVNWRR